MRRLLLVDDGSPASRAALARTGEVAGPGDDGQRGQRDARAPASAAASRPSPRSATASDLLLDDAERHLAERGIAVHTRAAVGDGPVETLRDGGARSART